MTYKYPVSQPYKEEQWLSHLGPDVAEFERQWATYIGTKYAVTCTSGTTALYLALQALRIGPGDEVIVPEFTMIATAWAVTYTGATPVFVDCGRDLNIDVNLIEAKITKKTKAIMPVHIYGRPCDMDKIMRIAYEYNLYVVEDAAEAHGATYAGKKVGSIGDIGCFSLYANKIITSGEGGILTTDSERVYKQLKHYAGMAFDVGHTFFHKKIGHNFRMTNMQAKVALHQLSMIYEILSKRRCIQKWYDESLATYSLPRLEGSVLWMYDMLVPPGRDRDDLREFLAQQGIETRVFFKPMSMQPMYFEWGYEGTQANYYSQRGLYLPTYTSMSKEDVEHISRKVLQYIG